MSPAQDETSRAARLRALFERGPMGIALADRRGCILECNQTLARMLGYAQDALVGRRLAEITHPDDLDDTAPLFAELASGDRTSICVQNRFLHKGGELVWLRVAGSRLDDSGTHALFVEDATDRQREEVSLRDREAHLRAILDTAAEGIIIIGESGRVLSFNRAAEQMFGYSAQEIVGQNVSMVMPPPYRQEHDSYIERYVRTGAAKIIGKGREIVGQRKDGTEFPVLLAVSEVEVHGRRTFTGIVRDITELKEAAQSMRRERDFVRMLVETAQDIVLHLDMQGRIVRFNSYTEKLAGYKLEEVKGQDWLAIFVAEEERTRFRALFGRAGDGNETSATVSAILTRAGQRRTISWSRSTITGDNGDAVGVLVIGHDITELKQAQETAVQSERLAAIGEMVTGLAHESRNALQRIQACLEMLELEVAGNREALDMVARIQRAQDQLAELYDDMRAYARPLALQRQLCEVNKLWRATWSDLELARLDKRVELVEECAVEDCSCPVDPYALQQVFRNIFENAISACPERGTIRVRCTDEGARLCIVIEDDGPGLGPEQLLKIFEPFYTTKTKGSGLGMPIVKRIVEAHGGTIEASNAASGGAQLVIRLARDGA